MRRQRKTAVCSRKLTFHDDEVLLVCSACEPDFETRRKWDFASSHAGKESFEEDCRLGSEIVCQNSGSVARAPLPQLHLLCDFRAGGRFSRPWARELFSFSPSTFFFRCANLTTIEDNWRNVTGRTTFFLRFCCTLLQCDESPYF